LNHEAFKNSRYTEGYACKFLKTSWQQHLSTREAFIHKNRSTQVKIRVTKPTRYERSKEVSLMNKKKARELKGVDYG
jgi:hypothetical protein